MRNSDEHHVASVVIFVANRFDRTLDALLEQGHEPDNRLTAYRRAADVIVTMNTPDTMVNMLYARSADDGTFQMALPPAYNGKQLYLHARPGDPGRHKCLMKCPYPYIPNPCAP